MFNLTAVIIVVAGAVNWFAIGAFQFDIIAGMFGSQSVFVSRFVYTLIGLAGFYLLLLIVIKRGTLELNPRKAKIAICKQKKDTTESLKDEYDQYNDVLNNEIKETESELKAREEREKKENKNNNEQDNIKKDEGDNSSKDPNNTEKKSDDNNDSTKQTNENSDKTKIIIEPPKQAQIQINEPSNNQ